VLNAANEQAVALFLEEKIGYLDIARLIEHVCDRHTVDNCPNPSLDDIIAADKWARQEVLVASKLLGQGNRFISSTSSAQLNAKDLHNLGIEKAEQKDYKGAIEEFNQALRINPDAANTYTTRGFVRYKLGDTQGAIADYNQAIQSDPSYARAYFNRGNIRRKLGDNHKAIADYNQAILLDSKYAAAYNNRGRARHELRDMQGANEDLQKAAELFFEEGDIASYKQAMDALNSLKSRQPWSPDCIDL
jgi:tetratricopeptide (TPR) repeat protein